MRKKPVNALFSEEQEANIVQAYVKGESLSSLARTHNCSKSTISRIINGAGVSRFVSIKKTPICLDPSTWEYAIPLVPFPECRFPGIYKFTNRVNGKIYIGQSRNIHLRYGEHRRGAKGKASTGLTIPIEKYGIISFNFEVIERVDDLTKLNEREQFWLDYHQPYKRSIGYNRARSATAFSIGCKRSDATKRANGVRMKAYFAANPHPNLGKNHSVETRKKLSESRKRNIRFKELMANLTATLIEKTTKRVAQIDPRTSKLIRVWKSVTMIHEELGIPASCIRSACRGFASNEYGRYSKTEHAGYKWEYTNLEPAILDEKHITKVKGRGKEVAQIDLNTGETLRVWGNAGEINRELGLHIEAIKCVCRGYIVNKSGRHPTLTYGGFKWQYV